MRRALAVLVTSLGLTLSMALPAGAAGMGGKPGRDGGGHAAAEHGRGGPQRDGRGRDDSGRRDDRDGREDRDGRFDHDRRYDNYDPYYSDPSSGGCPGGGYYDADGQYWYRDPGTGHYYPCYY